MVDNVNGRPVGLDRVFRVDGIGIESDRAGDSGLVTRDDGKFPTHFEKVLLGRNDWKLMSCCSEELVELDKLEMIVSEVGVGFCQKREHRLSWLRSPHLSEETRLDLLGQTRELWRV